MGNCGVRRQNRGFYYRAIAVGENSIQRDLNDVSEIQLNFVVSQGVEEAVERFMQLGFEVSDDADDLVDSLLVQHTARSVDEQPNVFVKLNVVRKKYHCLSQAPIVSLTSRPRFLEAKVRFWGERHTWFSNFHLGLGSLKELLP